ncbi:MAG TPA: ATP-binding protein [Steroidobacteraceae bacterium]|nr:ATP-binding protein [Steroidobacteraceae bacterium]
MSQTSAEEQTPFASIGQSADLSFFSGGGDMGARMRRHAWRTSSLGEPNTWPQSLRSALSICLGAGFQIAIYWGKDLSLLYNDAWSPILGLKHPDALGKPGREVWPEIWDTIGPLFASVFETGEATRSKDSLLAMHRHGFTEECYFDYTFSPIRDERGNVGGIFNAVVETTFRVIGERRTRLLRDLGERLANVQTAAEALEISQAVLAGDPLDVPFAGVYLAETHGDPATFTRAASFGFDTDAATSPWPLAEVHSRHSHVVVENLSTTMGLRVAGPWPEPCERAFLVPLVDGVELGVFVAGVSPRLALDEEYRAFILRVATTIGNAVARGRALDQERLRAQAIEELDRAKTLFFSNVSHEFRTPLTLMLGPLEGALADPGIPDAAREDLRLVQRNAGRLLKLVNSLLDFSRAEAGRLKPNFHPTDLAAFTRDIASNFRSAMEKAGLTYSVDCNALAAPVPIDHSMWEKVVLNLISNAFKYTLQGSIHVRLFQADGSAVLEVEDTGTGIAPDQLSRVFERFHRIENAAARTHEGSGIGLALVQELVQIHGGRVEVESQLGAGSTFRVRLPVSQQQSDVVTPAPAAPAIPLAANVYVEEALRWLPDEDTPATAPGDVASAQTIVIQPRVAATIGARVLLADDNADMRDYVKRLLSAAYDVTAVANGADALELAKRERFDLVLSDVMMPKLDGFGLLTALREIPALASLPVILVSARAGEEAVVEGLTAGADDYLVKPFSGRELLARVSGAISLARLRRETDLKLREGDERFHAVQDSSPDGFHVLAAVRDADGKIVDFRWTYLNEVAAREGRRGPPSWYIGRNVLDVHPGNATAGLIDTYIRVVETGVSWVGEIHFTFDGLDNMVRLAAARVGDGVAVSTVDISERHRAEQALKAADRQKDEFLAMLAHELRNPLAPIRTAGELLARMVGSDPNLRGAVEILRRQSSHLSRLVDDLLDVSRITRQRIELRRETVYIENVVRQAIETVEPVIRERDHDLRIHSSFKALCVNGDFARLVQCMVNVLTNAAKYTEPRGRIDVTTTERDGLVAIEVHDNGAGIPPSLVPRVFDLFVQSERTLDRAEGGLGIGLSVVRSLVRMHGGEVTVHSPGEGLGSTFTIELPLVEPSVVEAAADAIQRRVLGRIMVVDDNKDAADSLSMMLELDGHETRVVYTGHAAIAEAPAFAPQLVLLDIGLPEMDGYQVAQALRRDPSLGKTRLVALTGYGQPEDRARALAAGFDDHLVKPVAPDELGATIAKFLK